MKLVLFRLLAILLTFFIGVLAATRYLPESGRPDAVGVSVAQIPAAALPAETRPEVETPLEKTNSGEEIEHLAANLQKIAAFTHKKGVQTFFVSKVIHDNGDHAYAYWPEDDSITILQLPLDPEPSESQLYWFTMKARIDLKKDVVPKGKYENLGCCLVEKPWVDEVLSKCRVGYKLKIRVKQ